MLPRACSPDLEACQGRIHIAANCFPCHARIAGYQKMQSRDAPILGLVCQKCISHDHHYIQRIMTIMIIIVTIRIQLLLFVFVFVSVSVFVLVVFVLVLFVSVFVAAAATEMRSDFIL